MDAGGDLLVRVGIPTIVCAVVGALHGRRQNFFSWQVLLGAVLLSGVTCWSASVGIVRSSSPMLLPSWFIAPYGPFMGPNADIFPPWWLSPWLALATYIAAAFLFRETPASRKGPELTEGMYAGIRILGGIAAVIGICVCTMLTLTFIGISHCSLSEMAVSVLHGACYDQKEMLYIGILVDFVGIACGVAILFAKNRAFRVLSSLTGVLYGLFLAWFLLFGMAGMFGGGAY